MAWKKWRDAKKKAGTNRDAFLAERADELGVLMKTDQVKALKALRNAEASKQTYRMIRGITGHKKDRNPLTEVEITQGNNPQQYETLTDKESIERAIVK